MRQVDLMQPELDLQRKFEATLALTVGYEIDGTRSQGEHFGGLAQGVVDN